MQFLQIALVILFFLCCGILVFLILIQSGKGGSLGILGGAGSSTPFGSSTVDVVTKATWYGAAGFFTLALLAAWAFADSGPKVPLEPKKAESSGTIPGSDPAGKTAGTASQTQPGAKEGSGAAGAKGAPAPAKGAAPAPAKN